MKLLRYVGTGVFVALVILLVGAAFAGLYFALFDLITGWLGIPVDWNGPVTFEILVVALGLLAVMCGFAIGSLVYLMERFAR